jgi:hypothetical protein
VALARAAAAYDFLQHTRGQNLVISLTAMFLISGQFVFAANFIWSLIRGRIGRPQSVAGDDARMDRAVAAAARQLRRRPTRTAWAYEYGVETSDGDFAVQSLVTEDAA